MAGTADRLVPGTAAESVARARLAGARTPLVVLGGFLGAGKTTLLNHWLAQAGGRRLAVLVNDFGHLNVDAALLAAAGGDTIALANGCVCCQIGDDLSAALARVLDAPVPFDAILVEASGVSDPWRIAQIGLIEPSLALGGVVVLVDCEALPAQAADPLLADTLQRQLDAADWLVLNKTDRVDAAGLAATEAWLDAHAARPPRLRVAHGQLPITLLDEPRAGGRGAGYLCRCGGWHGADGPGDASHAPRGDPRHGEVFATWSAVPAARFGVPQLRQALQALPPGVLRLKGLVRSAEHGWSEVQFAGRHGSVRRAAVEPAEASLVAIGSAGALDAAALDGWLAAAQAG
ncbi:CobW family GTP-binding protein [Piscinibacter sakaiensis]|uniref:Putative metal chaperone n=1 Tax=Piscinibacter sakaiensis TaxID=1547922 RepID=A0A0K8NZT3_PISS1|nr:CobW family GTP-binding protein [Piscinibacter sakaiensis]GAP35794.1 putative metal chaperone [Piscinibacter sakaiensis]